MSDLPTQVPWRRFVCVLRKLGYTAHKARFNRVVHEPTTDPECCLIPEPHPGGNLRRTSLREERLAEAALYLRLVLAREHDRAQNHSEVRDEADRGSAHADREMSAIQQTQAGDFLEALNEALDRIDADTFGECLNCGQEIGVKRLEAIPWAQYCITCQMLINGG